MPEAARRLRWEGGYRSALRNGWLGLQPRRLLMGLGIVALLLIAGLADHIRSTTRAYQIEAAQQGAALMLTLQAKQLTRRMLGSLAGARGEDAGEVARADGGDSPQLPQAAFAAAWPALRERLADLATMTPRHGAHGLAILHRAMPQMQSAVETLRGMTDADRAPLFQVRHRILPLIEAVDGPLHEAAGQIERDGRALAQHALLRLAGELLLFALGFLVLMASSAVLVGLLMLSWRQAGAALAQARTAEEEARAAHAGLNALVEGVPALITTFDLELHCVHANRAVLRTFGVPAARMIGHHAASFTLNAGLVRDLERVRDTGQPLAPEEHEVRNAGGDISFLLTSTVPLLDIHGRPHRIMRTSIDITERRQAEQRARHLSDHDPLTDLPNRLAFQTELVGRLARPKPALALHMIDLDGFRSVNDSHGQATGDALLRAVARRLRGLVRRDDMLARLGGDEFALLQQVEAPAEATAMAARITQALAQPYQLGAMVVRCSASLGVAVLIEGEATAESMLARAELALASARRLGIGRFTAFSTEMEGEALERRRLQSELALALGRGELHLDYQPKFAMASGALEGVEALLRWHHPTRGPVSPGEFVPLAEEAGLALPLARFVLMQATAQINEWRAAGHHIPVAVNLSGELIGMAETLRLVEDVLADSGVPPTLLEIEVTESTFIGDSGAAQTMLNGLRALGIRVALDDFGTGFSSLAYLQELPIDVLKVDRCFVQGLGDGGASARIVDTVVRLAHGLGARVVAEGVETHEQLEHLRRMGCDSVQGFLLGRPQAPRLIPALLNQARLAQESLAISA